jgi:deoxyribodipyrimidine photolyase-related protein
MKILRLLLGDQLNLQHSWFKQKEENVQYAMFEMRQETDYAKHHIQKIVGFFTAMREMSEALKKDGHHVVYYKINDTDNKQDLGLNLVQLINEYDITHFEYQAPDEYRLSKQLEQICKSLKITHEVYTTEHFLVSQDFLKKMVRKR